MMKRTAFEQAALDLIAKAQESGEPESTIKVLQDALRVERKLACRESADRLFTAHQYKGCRYGQLSTVADNPVVWPLIRSLSDKARSLLLLILVITKTDYVSISRSQLAEITGFPTKRITAIMRELVESTALEVVSAHTNNKSTVYRISSALYRVGKLRRAKESDIVAFFKDDMPDYDNTKEWFQILLRRMKSTDYNLRGEGWYSGVSDVTINVNGTATKIKASVLQYYDPQKENEPSQSDKPQTTDPGDSPQYDHYDYITQNSRESNDSGNSIPGQMTIFDYDTDWD